MCCLTGSRSFNEGHPQGLFGGLIQQGVGSRDGCRVPREYERESKPLKGSASCTIGGLVQRGELNCIKGPSLHFVKRTKDELVPKGGDTAQGLKSIFRR